MRRRRPRIPKPGTPTDALGVLKWVAALVVAVLLGTAAAWWWASPGDGSSAATSVPAPRGAPAAEPGTALLPPDLFDNADATLGKAGGTAKAGASNDSLLTPDLLQTFEAMLMEANAGSELSNPVALKRQLAGLVNRYFAPEEIARALALAERYVDYRVALGDIKPPADPGDPRALRDALDARQRVREQYFTGEEADALFSADAQLDRYTLARLEIERNPSLTAAQKELALKEAEQLLSPAERAQRDEATAQVAVQAQTQAFDNDKLSDAERFAQRQAQYGEAAALQLAQLDRENQSWNARLDTYAAAQNGSSPEQIEALRQQLFSPEEQLRIEAALAARRLQAQAPR